MIAIKDMGMPRRCSECPFSVVSYSNGVMSLNCVTKTGMQMYAPDLIDRTDKPDWCPLCEITSDEENTKAHSLDNMFKDSIHALDKMIDFKE